MTDSYAVYDSVSKTKDLTHLGCWAHARRYFKEGSYAQPKGRSGKPKQALAYIQKLFGVDAKTKNTISEEKHLIRRQKSIPILASLKNCSINLEHTR
ncbi:MAG: hypothetical protein ACJASU_000850 [Cognaticolwellia sp.]|jgi:hypothetical protein